MGVVTSITECDAAASAHARTMGRFVKIFALHIPELKQLRELRSAFEQWVSRCSSRESVPLSSPRTFEPLRSSPQHLLARLEPLASALTPMPGRPQVRLERELETALAQYAIADEGDEEAAAFAAVEVACLHAEKLRGVVKCTTFQQKIYEHARKIVDANAAARLLPLAEEALWLLDKAKMLEVRPPLRRPCTTQARPFRRPCTARAQPLCPQPASTAPLLQRARTAARPSRPSVA